MPFYPFSSGPSGLPVFNVKQYGATGNGLTDDTGALQAAINAAGPTGATVFFPPGNYLISNHLLWDQSAQSTTQLAPSLIGAPGRPGPSSDIGNYGSVQITASATFPVGEFMIDYMGPVMSTPTPVALTGFTIQGLALRCASRAAGIRLVQEEDATLRDLVITRPATPNPANSNGNPKAAVNFASPSTGFSAQYNNVARDVYVFGAAQDSFYCSEGFPSSVTLDHCYSVQPGRYGFNCGPQTVLLFCDSQTSIVANYYVIGTTMIGCTEYVPCQSGNSVRINLDNTPWSANPAIPTVFIGCSFQGTNGSSLSEANGSVIYFTWENAHIVFSGCTFAGGTGTTDWLYVDSRNSSSAQALFQGCQFGAFGSLPGTAQYNLNGSGAVVKFMNCAGLNPFGTQTVTVPASGTAVAAAPFDRVFYVTANAAGATTIVVSGGPTVTLPLSALVPVFVPAGQTLTPTYVNAPTWVVEGL